MFEWDEAKRKQVINDHGVDFAKIADIFDDPYSVGYEDAEHSTDAEIRFAIIGLTSNYGLVYATYLYTNGSTIRFITARRAENWMVKEYEENRKRL